MRFDHWTLDIDHLVIPQNATTKFNKPHTSTRLRSKTLPHRTVSVLSTGGRVLSVPGQQVLFLLSRRDGKLKLHSFCGAPGLYAYSESLASLVKDTLVGWPKYN